MPRNRPKSAKPQAQKARFVFRVQEVAERLGVSEKHVLNLLDEGKLEAINIGTTEGRKFWRIPVASLEEFIKLRKAVD